MILAVILIVAAYLLGSVPFALVIGKGIYGTDVRQSGSGNIGTTNVFRVLGAKAGLLVFAGDMAKGFIPTYIATRVISADDAALVTVLVAGAAIVGHNWSIFLRGRGGKGVATGGGAVLAMMPWLFLLAFGVFWLVLLVDRRVSVASLSAAIALSVATLATLKPLPYIVFIWLGAAVVFYAHRSNIERISKGEESRISFSWNKGAGAETGARMPGRSGKGEKAAPRSRRSADARKGRRTASKKSKTAGKKEGAVAAQLPEGADEAWGSKETFAGPETVEESEPGEQAGDEVLDVEPAKERSADEEDQPQKPAQQTEDFDWEDPAK